MEILQPALTKGGTPHGCACVCVCVRVRVCVCVCVCAQGRKRIARKINFDTAEKENKMFPFFSKPVQSVTHTHTQTHTHTLTHTHTQIAGQNIGSTYKATQAQTVHVQLREEKIKGANCGVKTSQYVKCKTLEDMVVVVVVGGGWKPLKGINMPGNYRISPFSQKPFFNQQSTNYLSRGCYAKKKAAGLKNMCGRRDKKDMAFVVKKERKENSAGWRGRGETAHSGPLTTAYQQLRHNKYLLSLCCYSPLFSSGTLKLFK